jgi:SAM-dependent methyltransferase
MWDAEYRSGRWRHCQETPGAPVYRFIEQYCVSGSILDLGCGAGNTGNELDVRRYREYTGVDISSVAIELADRRSAACGRSKKNRYIAADIETYVPCNRHDVILFRESLYYVPLVRIKPMLDRYRYYLSERGVFIVNISRTGSKLFAECRALLTAHYDALEMRRFGEDVYVLVLR